MRVKENFSAAAAVFAIFGEARRGLCACTRVRRWSVLFDENIRSFVKKGLDIEK
jgi:hypothetical protein